MRSWPPITGKVGEEVERFLDRFLAPGFLAEPFLPPFPYETAGTEWFPMLDLTETAEEFIGVFSCSPLTLRFMQYSDLDHRLIWITAIPNGVSRSPHPFLMAKRSD